MVETKLFTSITVPKSRIKYIVGKDGAVRNAIEKKGKVRLFVHSDKGVVDINAADALTAMTAENVIKAIARGFSVGSAFTLFNEEYVMEIVDISDFKAKSKNRKETMKARIIGTKGITKRIIEQYTGCEIAIFGKTAAIIGKFGHVSLAKQAIEMILDGANQGTAYRFLQKATTE